MSQTREVRLPADLCTGAEEKFRGQFASLDELLVFILQELMRDDAAKADQAEQKIVEERLRELGYI